MSRYYYSYSTTISFLQPVRSHAVRLRCLPQESSCQRILESHLLLHPDFWWIREKDSKGGDVLLGGMRDAHHTLFYESSGILEVGAGKHQILNGMEHYRYLPHTALTIWDASMDALISPSMRSAAMGGNSHDLVNEICHTVHNHMCYESGSTSLTSTSLDAFRSGRGVCQDYAHLMLSMARSLAVPSRYVVGLVEGEGTATHAWVECLVGEEWIGVDPTHDRIVEEGYIKLSHGRDAWDCPVSRGTFQGITSQKTQIHVLVQPL